MLVLSLLVLAMVVIAGAGAAWYLGLDSGRIVRRMGAALTEAGERTSDRVADFRDWLRLGR